MTETPDAAEALQDLFRQAIERHRSFDFAAAEQAYREVLARDPAHADALHNLGVLHAIGLGQPQEALPCFEAALNLDPARPQFWFSYIDALVRAGQSALAEQVLPVAQANGLSVAMANGLAERARAARAAEKPAAGPRPAAPAVLQEADKQALVALFRAGDHAQGERQARALLELHPQEGFLWKALGAMLQQLGRKQEALAAKVRATELLPRDAEALCNLGRAHFELGDSAAAAAVLQRAVALAPRHAEAHNNLGLALNALGEVARAHDCFRQAVALQPDFAEALNNLSGIYTSQGLIDESVGVLQRAVAARPDYQIAFDNLLFVLNYHPDKTAEEIRAAYAEFDRVFGLPARRQWRPHTNPALAGRRLRVGYVSPDFRHHACSFFMEPLLQGHDRAAIEVFAYAEMRDEEDAVTARYQGVVDHWVPTRGLSDAALAERIRADGIDILVDLAGHTRGNRLSVFALKPAPVSLSWMGFGYTTGLTAIDHYLTDAAHVPPGSDHLFSEAPWRLADAPFAVYRPGEGMGEPGPLPALRKGHVTFGTLTRGVRINQHTVRVWAAILQRVPGARLVVDSRSYLDPVLAEALAARFAVHGIARDRLEIGCHSPPWDVLRGIDIGLDCFPHNSGTTLFESLYMGVPIVSLAARPSVGRVGSAVLHGLGRPEWVAQTEDGYIGQAVALAQDLPRLAALRAGLREEMRASALMDEPRFVRAVEDAYRAMFARWSARQAQPESIGSELAALQAELLYNQGNALHAQGRQAAAEEQWRQALALRPDHAEALNNLGMLQQEQGRLREAEASLRTALQVRPGYALALHNLGDVLQHFGEVEEALASFQQALAQGLATPHLFDNLLFLANYAPDLSAEQIFALYQEYDRRIGQPLRAQWRPHANARGAGRRLKVGYVSPDLRAHASARFLEPLLAAHDRRGFEITAYAELTEEDAVTARYRQLVDHWVPTHGLGDAELAERIRADGIDILVDLAGHTRGNRLAVFARKPAPVSLTWMGYGSTTGLSSIDYHLSDAQHSPPGSEAVCAEAPWRLPVAWVFRPAEGMGEPGPLPAERQGHVTFGSLSRSIRINTRTLRAWAAILVRLPGARLVLDSRNFADAETCARLQARFVALGVAPQQLQMGFHSPPWDVLRGIDVMLDCFPHNSGTTLFESLYLGVPFVTLAGRPSVGRLGSAVLQAVGHPEWIAETEAAYVDKAVALASDLGALARLRRELRPRMQASALMDEAGFAASVEAAYRAMFARWADATPAATPVRSGAAPTHAEMQALTELFRSRRFAEGAALAQALTERCPDHGFAFKALGVMLQPLGRPVEALAAKRRAAALLPQDAEAQCNLGVTLQDQGLLVEAETVLLRALALRPDYREAHNNLAVTYQKLGRIDASIQHFQRALAIDPGYEDIYSNMLFTLNYHPDLSDAEVAAHYREYDRRFGLPLRGTWQAHANARTAERRLKVGYVSPDFRRHACQRFLEPLLAAHDKAVVEVYAYAELAREDEVTQRYQALVDHWVPTRGVGDADLARRIRADGIDVLVDLAGHTVRNRLGVFAHKPAPVSVSWMGYGTTTGLSAIDHYLADAANLPQGCEALFAETPWRLPLAWAFRPAEGMGDCGPLPARARGHVTLCTLTRSVRINHRTLRAWAAILQRLPTARLVIDSSSFVDPSAQAALAQRFAEQGVDPARLQIGYHSPPWDLLRGADITLDCFPGNSGTTLFESLWMGVPFVTLAGRPGVGRMGSSVLHGVGHPEWIATDEAAYVDKVVALASDMDALERLRHGLRARMQASPLRDEAGFAHEVEQAYRAMFTAWCATDPHPLHALVRRAQEVYDEGNRLRADGQSEAAESCYRRALAWVPEFAEAQSNLGLVLQERGALDEAERCYREAVALQPDQATAHYNLGVCLKAAHKTAEAEAAFRQALALQPDFQSALLNLDRLLQEQGRAIESETWWRQALRERPDFVAGYLNLAQVLRQQQRNGEALDCVRRGLEIEPDNLQLLYAGVAVQRSLHRLDEAEALCRRVLALAPDAAVAWNHLAEVHNAAQRLVEAEAGYRHAIALDPQLAQAHGSLGIVLQNQGRQAEAEDSMRRGLQLQPNDRNAHGNLLFVLNYHPDKTGEQVFAEYQAYDQRFHAPQKAAWRAHGNAALRRRRGGMRALKVGYVSPDFRQHSVTNFLEPLLAQHDHGAVQVHAYAELQHEDPATLRYKRLVDHWVPTRGMSDQALAERIRADGIDVLVDLAGHTGGNRLGVFALKPAPVSVSWMGYGTTTGLSAIDWFLTDVQHTPPGSEHLLSEAPWRLPTAFVFRPAGAARMGDPGPLPALRHGGVRFCTLTRAVRINDHTVRVWSRLLQRVPTATLVIDSRSYQDAETQATLAARFAAHGIARERLLIGHHTPPWDLLREVDIMLDCFPHNSGTTLFESLYMGLPFVTLASRPSAGRLGSSILAGIGHPEWIADTEQEYIDKAAALAADLPRLAALRASLRAEMQQSRLMDEPAFARSVEDAYRQMFQRWEQEKT
ncbi:tetratricopeptide repeat protein [Pseudorhodoferax sp. Leaf274]|uniref:O-linked N-acetylglucosamine transferase family protein n=1 Tax=Pseudorhodoferax sp. Leaf274 TaxID=1736318 RepID=UPI0019108E88|nr:tetratricopeptide repeat protein [Pseudorhodoferax sp. Leaf274]